MFSCRQRYRSALSFLLAEVNATEMNLSCFIVASSDDLDIHGIIAHVTYGKRKKVIEREG